MEEMTELFYRDPYCREFDAAVTECTKGKNGWEIILDDTAFYPEGGGQPADHGHLNDAEVKDVRKKNGMIVHITDRPLETGSTVHGTIDWQRRFDHMQNHSGEHIVSGLIHKHFCYDNVGFHMGAVILLDFSGELSADDIRFIELEANRKIWENVPVKETFPDEEERRTLEYRSKLDLSGKVRIITIEGADVCACCGTHVARTGEIGVIHLLSVQKHGSGSRVEMLAGERALRYLEQVSDENTKISHLLSAKALATSAAVEKLSSQNTALAVRANRILRSWIELKTASLPDNGETVIFAEDLDAEGMRWLCNAVLDSGKAHTAVVLCDNGENACRYLIGSRRLPLSKLCREMNKELSGRGGGKDEMVQGTFGVDCEKAEAYLREMLK